MILPYGLHNIEHIFVLILQGPRSFRQDLFKQADADGSGELEFPEIQKVLERPPP